MVVRVRLQPWRKSSSPGKGTGTLLRLSRISTTSGNRAMARLIASADWLRVLVSGEVSIVLDMLVIKIRRIIAHFFC